MHEAARARAKAFRENLLHAADDEQACPPEWIDLKLAVESEIAELTARLDDELERFVTEPDIRVALDRRERGASHVRAGVAAINAKIRRMNLLTPLTSVQRGTLDADDLLRPLFRTPRRV